MGQLLFKKCFLDAIRAGTKRTTIRRWTTARLKPGQRAYVPGIGFLLIEAVDAVDLKSLTDSDAQADGFDSVRAMWHALNEFYPHARDGKDGQHWFRVTFHVEDAQTSHASQRARSFPRRGKAPGSRAVGNARPGPLGARLRDAASGRTASDVARPRNLSSASTTRATAHQRQALADHLRQAARSMFP